MHRSSILVCGCIRSLFSLKMAINALNTVHSGNYDSLTQENRIEIYFNQLRGEITDVLSKESEYRTTIQQLYIDLSVYKRAYTENETERERLQKLTLELEKQKEDLENRLKGYRIVALIDGDGAIFSDDLIAQGQQGGLLAAQKLSDSIGQYLITNYGSNPYQLWLYVFFNKRGLMDTLGRAGMGSSKPKFEDFMIGFNQAAERFLMVDVGNAKEAADAKIKAHLEDNIRLPQTFKILFGGCHDNGYVAPLRSLITAGFRDKLILLPGYTDMAAGIVELGLPSAIIPDLFMGQKIVTQAPGLTPAAFGPPPGLGPKSQPTASADYMPISHSTAATLPEAALEPDTLAQKRLVTLPTSYASALQTTRDSASTPELDADGSSASSDISEIPARASPTFTRGRYVNPNIPLSKHKPPPCTLFYLANCKHGNDCKYGHDYLLDDEHYTEIRLNAKRAPCPSVNKDEVCVWDEACCYGHVCPNGPKCHFFKQGRCKFSGVDMHRDI